MVRYIKEDINFDQDFDKFDLGEEWAVDIPKDCIKGATLLLREEYAKYKENILLINNHWWLQSVGYEYCRVCCVNRFGSVSNGCIVDNSVGGIRPALILNPQSSNLEIEAGDKFEFGEHTFTIISNKLAICDDFIGKGCFREDWSAEDANVYEKSDVKKVVDEWFNKAYNEYK